MSKELTLGLTLWIDENTFATSLLEKIFKQRGMPLYTLDNVKDFSFLVDDLKPEVIVMDTQTALKNKDAFVAQYEASPRLKDTTFILIGDTSEFSYLKTKGQITRPFDPYQIPDIIFNFKQ